MNAEEKLARKIRNVGTRVCRRYQDTIPTVWQEMTPGNIAGWLAIGRYVLKHFSPRLRGKSNKSVARSAARRWGTRP
jgi:hypothetical protein